MEKMPPSNTYKYDFTNNVRSIWFNCQCFLQIIHWWLCFSMWKRLITRLENSFYPLLVLFLGDAADQRVHFSLGFIGVVGLQPNASANWGEFTSTPLARNRPGLWLSISDFRWPSFELTSHHTFISKNWVIRPYKVISNMWYRLPEHIEGRKVDHGWNFGGRANPVPENELTSSCVQPMPAEGPHNHIYSPQERHFHWAENIKYEVRIQAISAHSSRRITFQVRISLA